MKTEHKIFGIFIIVLLSISLEGIAQDSTVKVGPNPFADSTTIYLPPLNNDTVTLVVYDRWGRVIRTFYDNDILSGNLQVTFNADTLPNALYILQFTLNGKSKPTSLVKVERQVPSGVEENSSTFGLKTYPNPASTEIHFESKYEINKLSVYSEAGMLLKELNAPKSPIKVEQDFKNGIYILRFESGENVEVRRILIENRYSR
jgi:hypothetical protein